MSDYQLVIIGCGLSGLAAGIRFARFGGKVLVVEQHHLPGGLNSYYYRQGHLLETGLHAMTNYAAPGVRNAPLNRLFRQLKLSRQQLVTHQQLISEILFENQCRLLFSNDPAMLREQIRSHFPAEIEGYDQLVRLVDSYDPFQVRARISARSQLRTLLRDALLVDMLLWPLMLYGSSEEDDMDFSQFVIMFRAIYQEGFFRPGGTIKDLLDVLVRHFREFGGEIRFRSKVERIVTREGRVAGVQLSGGEFVTCRYLMSTAGYPNTLRMLGESDESRIESYVGRMSFVEYIYLLAKQAKESLIKDRTVIFYQAGSDTGYRRPRQAVDPTAGVICFSDNFQGLDAENYYQLRVTHPANYTIWKQTESTRYQALKEYWQAESTPVVSRLVGQFQPSIVFQDSFTPLTIEKFTGKAQGAVYGSPIKIKNGRTEFDNLFIGGSDQGYLGIVGAMLSGVTMINQHILTAD